MARALLPTRTDHRRPKRRSARPYLTSNKGPLPPPPGKPRKHQRQRANSAQSKVRPAVNIPLPSRNPAWDVHSYHRDRPRHREDWDGQHCVQHEALGLQGSTGARGIDQPSKTHHRRSGTVTTAQVRPHKNPERAYPIVCKQEVFTGPAHQNRG